MAEMGFNSGFKVLIGIGFMPLTIDSYKKVFKA